MIKLFNNICLIGGGAFSDQLLQDIKNYKYQIYYNNKRLFINFFYTSDSRFLEKNIDHLYLITVAKPNIKEKIEKELFEFPLIDAIFVDSSVSKKIKYQKNLVVWRSFIGDNTSIGKNVYIGPYSIIAKGTQIGHNVSIYPRVSILKGSNIGDNVVIGTNSVITDGVNVGDNSVIGPNITVYNNLEKGSILIK